MSIKLLELFGGIGAPRKALEKKIPKNRLYALAGNSIVVDVLEAIFKELLSIVDFSHVGRKVNYIYFGQQSLFEGHL